MRAPSRASIAASVGCVALVALVILAPYSGAQTLIQPPSGDFEESYVVYGRVVNEDGWPVNQVSLTVSVTRVDGKVLRPVTVTTTCHGDFGAAFPVGAMEGKPRVAVKVNEEGNDGITPVSETQPVDTFYRRNNFLLVIPDEWPHECQDARDYWKKRITVWGRVVEGLEEPRTIDDEVFHSRAMNSTYVDLLAYPNNGPGWRPENPIVTGAHGDFQHSWIFDGNVTDATLVATVDGVEHNVTMDPAGRVGFFEINMGADPPAQSTFLPGPTGLVAMLAVAAVAVIGARRSGRS